MDSDNIEILNIRSLLIGYTSGKKPFSILPPVNVSASKGELVAVIGRNGIGKSTLLRTITGLQKALGGSVLLNDKEASGLSRLEFARKVGYISTEIIRTGHMRVYDLVALGRFPHTNWIGRIDQKTDTLIKESIKKAGIDKFWYRFISELSDGERQRAMIARVLAQDTDLMIMDEPMAFLDIPGKMGLVKLMKDLVDGGRTIIFSTHDLSIAVKHCNKIWLLDEGGIIQGAPEDLLLGDCFDCLFKTADARLNPEDGSFNIRPVSHTEIFIDEGESRIRHYTIKALSRAGFSVSSEKTSPRIRLPKGEKGWLLETDDYSTEHKTLYDLIKRLRENFRQFI